MTFKHFSGKSVDKASGRPIQRLIKVLVVYEQLTDVLI